MGRRLALLVAVGEYSDPLLRRLRAPAQDVDALRVALEKPGVGDFTEVRTVIDRPRQEIEEAIEETFAECRPDDIVLTYFTCHGVKDLRGRLYFAATNSRPDRLASTATSAQFVNEQMEHSRAGAKVALLDCCYSGAFAHGLAAKTASTGNLANQICGKGSYVITATNSLEYAYEDSEITDSDSTVSAFTDLLVQGLWTGRADTDGDGLVSPEDLHAYLEQECRSAGKPQTPTSFSSGVQGAVWIAKAQPRARPGTGATTGHDSVRAEVERHLRELEIRYSAIREVLPSGGRRTAYLDEIPAEAAALAGRAERSGVLPRRIESFATDDDAARVVTMALCTRIAGPTPETVSAVADGVGNSTSAFQQFWALCAAQNMMPALPQEQRCEVFGAVDVMLRSGLADADESRLRLAEWILGHEDEQSSSW
ncbi:caspase family protein [Saccharomonospora iraqiensis]|uniref:caspase family protein n=1 Tax=Saccharomonospora iraqiensis TaxID=52698 RepID=UPI00022E82CD|nr:caspase family protein [Saccharomonospora iraqiensis]